MTSHFRENPVTDSDCILLLLCCIVLIDITGIILHVKLTDIKTLLTSCLIPLRVLGKNYRNRPTLYNVRSHLLSCFEILYMRLEL